MASLTVASLRQAVGGPVVSPATLKATLMRSRTERATLVDGADVTFATTLQTALPVSGPTTINFGAGSQPAGTFWHLEVSLTGRPGFDYIRNFVFPGTGTYDLEDTTQIDPRTFEPTAVPPEPAWGLAIDDLQQQIDDIVIGSAGDLGRDFVQSVPAASWLIPFPEGIFRLPSVTVRDLEGNLVGVGHQADLSTRTVTISFPAPFAGTATLN